MERSLFLLVILLAGQSSSLQSSSLQSSSLQSSSLQSSSLQSSSLQRFQQVPSSREVRRGESLTLACLVAHLGGECRWEREGLPVGQYDEKYVWAGDRTHGDCSLTILDIHPDFDAGLWSCQVSASNITAGDSLISPAVRVSVVTPPTELYIQDGATGLVLSPNEEITVKQGDYLHLTCVAMGGRPAPALSWQSDRQLVQAEASQTNVLLLSGDWVASRQLTAQVEAGWSGEEVACVSRHSSELARTRVRLRVLTRPVISHISLTAGQLYCHVEAGQEDVTVSWHRADQPELTLSGSALLSLTPLTPQDVGDYVCLATNSVGTTEGRRHFSYEFPARLGEVTSGPVTASLGSSLELQCEVLASPPASVWWVVRRDGAGQQVEEVGRGPDLVIPSVSYSESGQYQCRARNTVGTDVTEISSRDIEVRVAGGPLVSAGVQTDLLAGHGDNVELRADYCSSPASKVSWTDGEGRLLSEDDGYIFSLEHRAGPCYTAKLFILNVESFHNGVYMMRVENDIGTAEQEFRLSLQNDFHNFEVLVAISGGLILTVMVLMFVVMSFCHRQHVRLTQSEISSRETESETDSRDNSAEELLFNIKADTPLGVSSLDQSHKFNNVYSFPLGGGSLRKSQQDRKVYHDSSYVHINTNSYSYVSYDDVDKQISNIL